MIIFDIEANGLLDDVTEIHCIVTFNTETGVTRRYNNQRNGALSLRESLYELSNADVLIGHNILGYDLPAIRKVLGWHCPNTIRVMDTLPLGRLAFPAMRDDDFKAVKKNKFPAHLAGMDSLEAWGRRLKVLKGDYGLQGDEEAKSVWNEWSIEMEDYCVQDVEVTRALWSAICNQNVSPMAMWIEAEFARIMARQERRGVRFNVRKAEELSVALVEHRRVAGEKLKEAFGHTWTKDLGDFIPKVNNNARGYVKGVPTRRFKQVEFNPGSAKHIARMLMTHRGWKPTVLTEGAEEAVKQGKRTRAECVAALDVKVDEATIKDLPYPEIPLILEYLMLNKRIGQLSQGKQGWLRHVKNGRIHGRVKTMHTVTHRCAHSNPNMAQVPAVGSPFGRECRELFEPTEGLVLVGCDASGCQVRCLAHYLGFWDKGNYARIVTKGDFHEANRAAMGLKERNDAKAPFYAFLFGAGADKITELTGKDGRKVLNDLESGIPGLSSLINGVKATRKRNGFLRGLDGRKYFVHSDHVALVSIIQGAEAIIMKLACIIADWNLQMEGLVPLDDDPVNGHYESVLNVHDEMQFETLPCLSWFVGQVQAEAIKAAGIFLNLNCEMAGEYKIGKSWADTH